MICQPIIFEIYKKSNWAESYDVIIHDECAADITDPVYVETILKAHRDGKPAVKPTVQILWRLLPPCNCIIIIFYLLLEDDSKFHIEQAIIL